MIRVGYLAVAAAAVLWAVGGNVASRLIDRGASPVELTAGRSAIALAGVGLIVLLRRSRNVQRPVTRWLYGARWIAVAVFGLSLAAANFTYYAAIGLLPVAVAIVIQYTAPGLVVLWKGVSSRRRPSGRVLFSLGLALAGVVLLSEVYRVAGGGQSGVNFAGVAVAIGSAVAFASYVLVGEVVERALGAERSVFAGFVVATIFWTFVIALRGRADTLLDAEFLPGIVFLGIAATIAPFLLFVWGLGIVGASRAGITSTLEPVSAAIIAFLWLGQALSPLQIVGAAAVVLGIAIIQSDSAPVHTSLEHGRGGL